MELTGRKVFLITASAFGVIIAVNVTMAVQAVRTFPGLEVKNSYVASQSFDAEREAQEALGWTVKATVGPGALRIEITGQHGKPVEVAALEATVGRPTERKDDLTPVFAFDGSVYSAPVDLPRGYWNVWLQAEAQDGTAFRQRIGLYVKD